MPNDPIAPSSSPDPGVGPPSDVLANAAIPELRDGRTYTEERVAGAADVDPAGSLRFDAAARWLQDMAAADVADAGLDEPAWVVRRTYMQVQKMPRLGERVALTTACTGMATRWAERRTDLVGPSGTVRSATTWVRLDPRTGRPSRLSDAFRRVFDGQTDGRSADHGLVLPPEPPATAPVVGRFSLRRVDLDPGRHVNNAVFWAVLEEHLPHAGTDGARDGLHALLEFRVGADADVEALEVVLAAAAPGAGDATALWIRSGSGGRRTVHAVGTLWRE